MAFDPTLWTRLEFDRAPIWVQPGRPDWFVPNKAGDRLLRELAAGRGRDCTLDERRFLQRLPAAAAGEEYRGRATHLSTDRLSELWLHVTNRCNMTCGHCLFSSAPDDAAELPAEWVLDIVGQACELGVRVFALTGGEPFVHRRFERIVDGILSHEHANVAVLTNGTLLDRRADAIDRWDRDRFHLQVSLDGLREAHDGVRGPGAFDKLMGQLAWARGRGLAFTLSMCVSAGSAADMPGVVDLAAEIGATNVHFMWYFVRGRGGSDGWAQPKSLMGLLTEAGLRAERHGLRVDNIEALRSQAFAPAGTIHDGTGAGWQSVAVGPDSRLYPSPAMVGIDALATPIDGDLGEAWRTSAVLDRVRGATVASADDGPLRLLLGGGDSDHSYMHSGEFVGGDPYRAMHERVLLWLIAREAGLYGNGAGPPRLRLKMGDVLASCGPHGAVATVHNNCLLTLAGADGRAAVGQFYADAAHNPREDIRNPVSYPPELIEHIPAASRVRSYGCGSPVIDAGLGPGECVVDLGCGTGVECFIASRLVGPVGRVVGVDMLDAMLTFARKGAEPVAARLGYANVEFRKGLLESLPVDDGFADVVLSNCVLNLSSNKRRTFAEIRRALRKGGRLVASDVVCETEPDPAIRNDPSLRGECIAGAMTQADLFGLLGESGLVGARAAARFPYRTVGGHRFFSLTFEAYRPAGGPARRVMYRGSGAGMLTGSGKYLPAGVVCEVDADDILGRHDDLFEIDADGAVMPMPDQADAGSACCACAEGEQEQGPPRVQLNIPAPPDKR